MKRQLIKTVMLPRTKHDDNCDQITNQKADSILMVYKNYNDDGSIEKTYEIINNPTFTYYIDKELDPDIHQRDYVDINSVEPVTIKHAEIYKSIALNTGNDDFYYENAKSGGGKFGNLKKLHLLPWVHGTDIHLADYYIADFYEKNEYDNSFKLSKCFFDIEVDSIDYTGFPKPDNAICPINAISIYFDEDNTLYELLLRNSVNANPQIQEFEKNIDAFQKRMVNKYKNEYNIDVNIKVVLFDNEMEMLTLMFGLINIKYRPDFVLAWNMTGFDIPYIISRINQLGFSPNEIMCDKDMEYCWSDLHIDNKTQKIGDKNSYYNNTSYTNYMDQLLLFAALRKQNGERDSYSLDAIAEEELNTHKYHYKDSNTTIKNSPYVDYAEFVEYNLHDTMLLSMIEDKNKDVDLMYTISVTTNTRIEKAFKKTVSITNLARKFYKQNGKIMSNNHNQTYGVESSGGKDESFRGAFVADPMKNDYVGKVINGHQSKYFHENVIDYDFSSLYPSIIISFNLCNESMIGALKSDTLNTSDVANKIIANDEIAFGKKYFNLPNVNDLLNDEDIKSLLNE